MRHDPAPALPSTKRLYYLNSLLKKAAVRHPACLFTLSLTFSSNSILLNVFSLFSISTLSFASLAYYCNQPENHSDNTAHQKQTMSMYCVFLSTVNYTQYVCSQCL